MRPSLQPIEEQINGVETTVLYTSSQINWH